MVSEDIIYNRELTNSYLIRNNKKDYYYYNFKYDYNKSRVGK